MTEREARAQAVENGRQMGFEEGYAKGLEDAAEEVHGQWVEWYPPMHMIMTGEEMLYRCSACDAKYPDVEGYRFCPRCGKMMDGGSDYVE